MLNNLFRRKKEGAKPGSGKTDNLKGPQRGRAGERAKPGNGAADTVENYLATAIVLFEEGEYTAALKNFNLIAAAIPGHPLAHLMRGRCLMALGKLEQAIAAFHEHLRIVPNSVEALIHLGLAYFECKHLELAQEKFDQALALRRESLLAQENAIITKIFAGRLEEALEDLLKLREQRPHDKNISELLILTAGRLGKWELAMQHSGTAPQQTK